MSARLRLRDLSARYLRARELALSGLSLTVEPGELVALLGPSGSGKTTALKLIAGLLTPASGEILIDDEPITRVPPEKRRAAMVFQKPLLFPHMSALSNVGFGLRMRGTPKEEALERAREALERVHMEGYGERRPGQLSGGQQQRVALARALITEPRLLLLDEPFTALDANLRQEMRSLVHTLQREGGYTTVFVTHDQEEAVAMADRIALLFEGELQMYDRPQAFYERPLNRDVAEFFGSANFLPGRTVNGSVETTLGRLRLEHPTPPGEVTLTIRPEAVRIEEGENSFPARVSFTTYLGTQTICELQASGLHLRASLPPHTSLRKGDEIQVRLPADSLWPLKG